MPDKQTTIECISALPTGCIDDSACCAAGRCLLRPEPDAPKTAERIVTGGGGGQAYAPSRTITGNPWRIHCLVWDGAYQWIEFENGQRIRQDVFEAIRDGRCK